MTGSVQQKNGKYYAVLNLYDEKGKRKQKWIATGYPIKGNKKRAEKFLRDKLSEFKSLKDSTDNLSDFDVNAEADERQCEVKECDKSFTDCIIEWLDMSELRVDPVTYQGYKSAVDRHILPFFEKKNLRLIDVKRKDIQDFINEKHKNGRLDGKGGLSAKSIKIFKTMLNSALREAVKDEYIVRNPCEFVVLPQQNKFRPSFYNGKQAEELLEKTKDDVLYPIILIALLYGLRRSEIVGLKWDSIDFENDTLTVNHTVSGVTEMVYKDKTKSCASYRTFPLIPNVKNILLDIKRKERENTLLFGSCYNRNSYIFKWENGNPYRPDFITRRFSKLLKQNDLPHIRFHDLRHSCASYLVAKGYTLKDIQEWMGHADISPTANIYAHLDTERKNKIAEEMALICS
ncbi:MAG: site-specific integrase [Clostridiales bacterium]|nr:site-specific integrase [Clostridiales bacterium]